MSWRMVDRLIKKGKYEWQWSCRQCKNVVNTPQRTPPQVCSQCVKQRNSKPKHPDNTGTRKYRRNDVVGALLHQAKNITSNDPNGYTDIVEGAAAEVGSNKGKLFANALEKRIAAYVEKLI